MGLTVQVQRMAMTVSFSSHSQKLTASLTTGLESGMGSLLPGSHRNPVERRT